MTFIRYRLQAKINALRELQSRAGEELDALLPSVLDTTFKSTQERSITSCQSGDNMENGSSSLLCFTAVLVLISVFLLAASVHIVREDTRLSVYRLGRYVGEKGPGVVILIPVIDRTVLKELSPAEGKLWAYLRDDRLGVNFRRQHAIGKYIADFPWHRPPGRCVLPAKS